jgi:diaminopimelate decarboxylase
MHIGSQIFSTDPFRAAAVVMADFAAKVKKRAGYEPQILNYGGGPAVAYRITDEPPQIEEFVNALVTQTAESFKEKGVSFGKIAVEPGRSIVGPAAFTLYRIGTLKEIPGVRFYVSVDGGMSDNLRPMLYGAIYEAFIATKMNHKPETRVTIAGKHCENGDILIRDVELPYPVVGDILVVPVTGAYGYAMANNYNLQPRPAVVFVRDGEARLVVKRESYEDLIRNQMI